MSHTTQYVPANNEFEVLMDKFEVDYRAEFENQIINGAASLHDARTLACDVVIVQYPELEHCYKVHGIWHEHDYDAQPTAAHLGRKIAGLMYRISQNYKPSEPETAEPSELSEETIEHARWITRSDPQKITKEVSVDNIGPTKTRIVADGIKDLKPGYFRTFTYDSAQEARNDQVLLAGATDSLGWNDGNAPNTRAYQSKVKPCTEYGKKFFCLTIERLTIPRPTRRRKPRGQ